MSPGAGRLRALAPRGIFEPRTLLIGGAVLLIAYLALVPLVYLITGTFLDEDGFTLQFVRDAYGKHGLAEMALNSLRFAAGSTMLAVALGTVLAYLIVRTDVPFKRLMFAVSLVPLVIPGVLHTIAWIFLLSPRAGALNSLFEPLLGGPLFDIFSLGGMILVQGLHLVPLVFLLMAAAFRSMDPALEEAALMSGARLGTVFRRITLPAIAPALFAAILVMAVRSLEAFEVPALLGIPDGTWVFTSRIWRALGTYPRDFGAAGAYSMPLILMTTVGVYLHSRFSRRGRAFQTLTGRGPRPRALELGRWRRPAAALIVAYFFVALVLPLLMLLYGSTQPFFRSPSIEGLSSMSLQNYRTVLGQDETIRAFRNSLLLGIASATAVMLLMGVASWFVVRTKAAGRWMVDNLAFLPLSVPSLILGVALLFVYLRVPLPIYGTLWILFIAYLTVYMPYGMRYASASMHQVGSELEESAQVSGATWWKTLRRVILPLLMPGLLAGWIYILVSSVRELSTSILVYSPGREVLGVRIFELWQSGKPTELAALGVVLVTAMVPLVVVAYRLGSRIGLRAPGRARLRS